MANESSCSTLAITEKKKPQRPGGCVGIFFQLFDWNRRLAKMKLKLLAPARAKQASKKFLGSDKLSAPKLHLIDDENCGGFPNVRKIGVHGDDVDHKHSMQSPSLIARLMGLETMPSTQKDKPRKTLDSVNGRESEENFVVSRNRYAWEDTSSEKRLVKHELRPPKLQKTGQFDRRAVTRFGSEALQLKNVLSRSRKHHHHHPPKHVSPVKSPKVHSGKNASRWIDAAARILEPGLQATNRAKCTLTYANSSHCSQEDKVMTEGITVLSPNILEQICYRDNSMGSFVGQSSCHNCNIEYSDVLNHQPNVEEYPSVFSSSLKSYVNPSCQQGPIMSKPRPPKSHFEQKRGEDFQNHLRAAYHLSKAREIRQSHNEPFRDNRPFSRDSQERWHITSQARKPHKDEQTPITLKHISRSPGQMSMGRERMGTRSKVSNSNSRRVSSAVNGVSGAKDFVALNRTVSGRTRSKMPTRVDNYSKLEAEGQSPNRQEDSVLHLRPPIRKRRSTNVGEQVKPSKYSMQDFGSLETTTYNGMVPSGGRLDAHSMKQSSATSHLTHKKDYDNKANCSINVDAMSFEFNSPIKKKIIPSPKATEKQSDVNGPSDSTTSELMKLIIDANKKMTCSKKSATMDGGDALGALLAQKLKELSCQEEDEMGTVGSQSKRTTSVILQELIAALTVDQPISQDDGVAEFGINGVSHFGNEELHDDLFSHFNGEQPHQARTKLPGTASRFTHDDNNFSPGSVLDASFFTESCISSSFDDNSEIKKLVQEEMNCSYDRPPKLHSAVELLDSATSLDKDRTGSQMIFDVINLVSDILQTINVSGIQLPGSKLSRIKEVLLNSELLFSTAVLHTSQGNQKVSVGPLLLDELETLAAALWTNSNCLLGFDEAKDENMLTEFLFDCVIEYLDTRYAKYLKCGFKTFSRLLSSMSTMLLIQWISNGVKSWTDLAEMIPDEIIEFEMSHGPGKWTDFDVEVFETGVEMDGDILQRLVDEIVTDLCLSRRQSF